MKIIVMFDNKEYEIDTEKTPKALNSKQIELISHMLNIPEMIEYYNERKI